MATLVEVTTQKPRVQDVTLKLTLSEARDLQVFITEWYEKNFFSGGTSRAKTHGVYAAIQKAIDGKADASVVKIAAPVF